jgi:NAD(P)-dependent dehydrogenase (short-subunit alcohol dehydrogenase family)
MRLEGKNAVVTGAGLFGSIGWGIARILARDGANVAVLDIDEAAARATAGSIEEAGVRTIAMRVDVADYQAVRAAAADIIQRWNGIDIWVNNAGICHERVPVMTWEITEDEFDRIVAVNCKGVWNGCRAVVPHMLDRKAGKIVNISSVVSKKAYAGSAVYTASKYFINGLTSALAKEVAPFGINVNCVAPGFVRTPCVERLLETQGEAWGKTAEGAFEYDMSLVPMGRPQSAEDIGFCVAFLASDEANQVTGQCYSVDGGDAPI